MPQPARTQRETKAVSTRQKAAKTAPSRIALDFNASALAEAADRAAESAWQARGEGLKAIPLTLPPQGERRAFRPSPALDHSQALLRLLAALQTGIGEAWLYKAEAGAKLELGNKDRFSTGRSTILIGLRGHIGANGAGVKAAEIASIACGSEVLAQDRSIFVAVETAGSSALLDLLAGDQKALAKSREMLGDGGAAPRFEAPAAIPHPEAFAAALAAALPKDAPGAARALADRAVADWRGLWAMHGDAPSGWQDYRALAIAAAERLGEIFGRKNAAKSHEAIDVLRDAVSEARLPPLPPRETKKAPAQPKQPASAAPASLPAPGAIKIEKPVFIAAPPRSGALLLYETLAVNRAFLPLARRIGDLTREWLKSAGDKALSQNPRPGNIPARALDASDDNARQIGLIRSYYPDAAFIVVYREPADAIASQAAKHMLDGLDDKEALGRAALEWRLAAEAIVRDAPLIPRGQAFSLRFEALVQKPRETVSALCKQIGVPFGPKIEERTRGKLPPSAGQSTDRERLDIERLRPEAAKLAAEFSELSARLKRIVGLG